MENFDFSDIDFNKLDADLAEEEVESALEEFKKLGPEVMAVFTVGRAVGRFDIIKKLAKIINAEMGSQIWNNSFLKRKK